MRERRDRWHAAKRRAMMVADARSSVLSNEKIFYCVHLWSTVVRYRTEME